MMSMPKMVKGKHMSNMLTCGAMFSTFKCTDSHTVHSRPTRKDGVVTYELIFRNVSFHELKIAKESHYLAKISSDIFAILLASNQKSNELSMNRKCEQSVTTDERKAFTKVLGADKDKVHRDQTPETTTTQIPCLTGARDWRICCQSNDKRIVLFM